jgi:hypothetical protein
LVEGGGWVVVCVVLIRRTAAIKGSTGQWR